MTSICRYAVTSLLQAIAPRKLRRTICQLQLHPNKFEFSPDFLMDGPELRTLAERNIAVMDAIKAVRVADKIQIKAPNALDFVIDATWDKYPDNFPSWNMLEEYFEKIRALPGSAHAFRYLLVNAEQYRRETLIWTKLHVSPEILETKVYGMCNLLAQRASAELEDYENIVEGAIRPADIYRAYGLALRYATEELGSFVARRILAKLMMASPLPIDELENPDWIDPYTSELDEDYTYLKVKETAEVSSDGNMPVMIQDLLSNMGDEENKAFEEMLKKNEMSLDDYWLQFREAQRSGYAEVAEPEDSQEEPEFDVREKDFSFKEDLLVDTDEVNKLKGFLSLQLSQIELFKALGLKEAKARWAEMKKFDYDAYHERLLKFPATQQLFRILTRLACFQKKRTVSMKCPPVVLHSRRSLAPTHALCHKQIMQKFFDVSTQTLKIYEPKTIMASILRFQGGKFGLWEEDLYNIHIPGDQGFTLAHWYAINGEEFLEQFITKGGVDYGDKEVNKENGNSFTDPGDLPLSFLDDYARRTARAQSILYRNGEKKRAYWAQKKGRPYKPDASWHPAFVNAEVETAILGEGGSNSAKSAGWDAWRNEIDPEANQTYKLERKRGTKHAQAMQKFWEAVKANKNRIAKIGSQGLTLRSGRVISWSIALMKLKAYEIPITYEELHRFENHLKKNRWGTKPLLAYLEERIAIEFLTL